MSGMDGKVLPPERVLNCSTVLAPEDEIFSGFSVHDETNCISMTDTYLKTVLNNEQGPDVETSTDAGAGESAILNHTVMSSQYFV